MKNIATGLVLAALVLAGCKKDTKTDDVERFTSDIEKLADRACACTDAACAEKVVDDFVNEGLKNKAAKGDRERTDAAAKRLGTCVIKAGMSFDKLQSQILKLQKRDD